MRIRSLQVDKSILAQAKDCTEQIKSPEVDNRKIYDFQNTLVRYFDYVPVPYGIKRSNELFFALFLRYC